MISNSVVCATSDSAESGISVEIEGEKPDKNDEAREFEQKDDEYNLISYGVLFVLLYMVLRIIVATKAIKTSKMK